MSEDSATSAFGLRTLIILIVAGIVFFGGFLVLGAYAPEMRGGRDGRAHALSTSAVGFRGIHDLMGELGHDVSFTRDLDATGRGGLLLVTIGPGGDEAQIAEIVDRAEETPTLIVLPKWITQSMPGSDRVRSVGPFAGQLAGAEIAQVGAITTRLGRAREDATLAAPDFRARFTAPVALQAITGKAIEPLIETNAGDVVLGRLRETEIYILADPDLINNMALDNPEDAAAAVALLEELDPDGPFRFDLTVPGFAGERNLLKLAFEPPFLALTLCILAAAILAGLHAAFRFGPARREPRAIALGKRALVDNSADLIRVTRRERLSAERYVAMTREAAVAAIGNPRRLEGEALDRWLDNFTRGTGEPFTALAHRALGATTRHDILAAARALHQWKRTVTHEG